MNLVNREIYKLFRILYLDDTFYDDELLKNQTVVRRSEKTDVNTNTQQKVSDQLCLDGENDLEKGKFQSEVSKSQELHSILSF